MVKTTTVNCLGRITKHLILLKNMTSSVHSYSYTRSVFSPGLSWLNSLVTVVSVAVWRPALYPGGAAAGGQAGGEEEPRPSPD